MAQRRHSLVKLDKLPRLADFAVWSVAAEPAHSRERIFLKAYAGNRDSSNQVAIEASIIGPVILALVERSKSWEGLTAELFEALNGIASDSLKKSKAWPKSPRAVGAELSRIAPNLRAEGINVVQRKRTNRGYRVILEQLGKT